MAYSKVTYTGDGSTTDFAVPFPYLEQAHVGVSVGGVAVASTLYSWITSGIIRITTAPSNGAAVVISRDSSRATRLSDYQDAQVLTEADLDYDAKQIFYVAQEAFDAVSEAASGGDMLRANNLSDVLNVAAARANLGVVASTGGTFTGPVFVPFPTYPNQIATKGYVDAVVASSGSVTSFNTRTGAVTLGSSDVTGALGYTPVNKAGDTMTGALTLAADPAGPLQAATKQYVDSIASSADTGDYEFPQSNALARAMLTRSAHTPSTNIAGAMSLSVTRSGGVVGHNIYSLYNVTDLLNSGTDSGFTSEARASSMDAGGELMAGMFIAKGPTASTNWAVNGLEVQVWERVGDQGIMRDRTGGKYTTAYRARPGIGYNISYGYTVLNQGTEKTWIPFYVERDSMPTGGVAALLRGNSSAGTSALSAIEIRDHYQVGLDLRNATFNYAGGPVAIWLDLEDAILFGPTQKMYAAADNEITFYDPVSGTVKLSTLVGGGSDIRPLDNTFTGNNVFEEIAGSVVYDGISTITNDSSVIIKDLANGVFVSTAPSIIVGHNYKTSLDVQKTTDAATVADAWQGGDAAVFIQHQVTGQYANNATALGLRVQLETSQIKGAYQSDAAAGYFGLMHKGNGSGGFGLHVDAYHSTTGAGATTYGSSVEMYRSSTTGVTVGYHVRSVDSGAYNWHQDFGFLASPGGSGTVGYSKAIAVGSASFGATKCTVGVDLVHASSDLSALAVASNKYLTLSTNYTDAQLRYNSAIPAVESLKNGSMRFAHHTNQAVIFAWDGVTGSAYNYWMDFCGATGRDAVFQVASANRTTAPANTTAIANWLAIRVDGTRYHIPLYL